MWHRIDLAEADAISLGQSGANIGMAIGRSIGAETETELEIHMLGPVRNKRDQGTCSKKGPA